MSEMEQRRKEGSNVCTQAERYSKPSERSHNAVIQKSRVNNTSSSVLQNDFKVTVKTLLRAVGTSQYRWIMLRVWKRCAFKRAEN
jgi:hypothetical protein